MYNAPVSIKLTTQELETAHLFNYENLKEPEQINYDNSLGTFITKEGKNFKINIFPQANYRIYAMVMSKNRYYLGWTADIAPYDLALGWNELMLPENQRGITYSQSDRWYYYRYDGSFPLGQQYIIKHSSNHHIIPANKNVLKAIDKVRTHERIYMDGHLVKINGTNGNDNVFWNSSMTRDDTGNGACEIFYVKRAVVNGLVYE